MTHIDTKIASYIAPGRRVHLAGIGGVSMSPLAEVLHGMGLLVQGSDQADSAAVARLRVAGHLPSDVGHEASDDRRRGVRGAHRRHPRRQPGDRRRPGRGHPRL